MKSLLRLLLKNQHQQNRSKLPQTEKGMTLVELLVGSIMAFLIITPMLAFVVDMLNTDRREQVKSNTEQDIQAAVDFISQDLSQAIYIYDNNSALTSTSTTTATGIPVLLAGNFIPPKIDATQTPILVFWKRQRIKNSLPVNRSEFPKDCNPDAKLNDKGQCNDTDVLSLVAYYQIKETTLNSIWCQPSGAIVNCPTRIARYEIRDGVRNPYATDITKPYYSDSETIPSQRKEPAFNQDFDFNKPTEKVTMAKDFGNPEVLVNYIDHSLGPILTACTTALGNPTDSKTQTAILEDTLKVTDPATNSFYACVDTAKNIASITIRGNSLRRLQDSNVASSTENSAFFPTATFQIKGLGARSK
jgi:hypothetical protein